MHNCQTTARTKTILERKKDTKSIDSRCFHADVLPKEIKQLTWHNDQGYLMIGTYLSVMLATMVENT